ncbi:Sec63 Brl domain-containing protein [Hysterangium stoloniferum]|nr:Sec63 Brl domain-containing protein [Hysterangium stoloniferum]
MAQYQYDGSMAAYFLLTFLSLALIPLTYSLIPAKSRVKMADGCQCQECLEHRRKIRSSEEGSFLRPKFGKTAFITAIGWAVFAVAAYKVAMTPVENKIYDPFAILNIARSATEQEIKKHYKRLSLKFHPDKVKLGPGDTMESIQDHFVNITKAYKALTDETIRRNVIDFNDPDGRQQFSTGIAIPHWIVESQNSIWVLGFYALVFGAGLPALVGRWWFGSRRYTKDGVLTRTAELFFKSAREDITEKGILVALATALPWEKHGKVGKAADVELGALMGKIDERLGSEWVLKAETSRALTLIYAHLLRIPVNGASLQALQKTYLLHIPSLLNSLLTIILAHNWLPASIQVMNLQARFVQAVASGEEKILQFPGMTAPVEDLPDSPDALIEKLEATGDGRAGEVKKVGMKWGKLDVVDVAYKVIGERFVSPGAIVQLVFKLRTLPPVSTKESNGTLPNVDKEKQEAKMNEERDQAFLVSKKDFEDLPAGEPLSGWVHAPKWPTNRRAKWWVVLGDDKTNKVVVPPMWVSDLPYGDPHKSRNYRTFKMQFQAPQGVGLYTWRIRFISDVFIGEDVARDLTLKVEDLSLLTADEQHQEDQISDPEEDTLAGQMAAMRGGSVKKIAYDSDESSTDDDQEDGSDSSSDSD